MVGMHVRFEMKPGMEQVLLDWKKAEGVLQVQTPGFIKRSMTRDIENPNVFYYVSFWRTREQMLGFLHSPHFEEVIQGVGVRDAILSRSISRVEECFDDDGLFPND